MFRHDPMQLEHCQYIQSFPASSLPVRLAQDLKKTQHAALVPTLLRTVTRRIRQIGRW